MSQQLVLTPLGLVTEPNKLGQIPAGALSVMTDCVERSPGIIENLPAWTTRATIPSDAGTTAAFVIATPGPYMLVVFNVTAGWRYCWFDQTSGSQLFGGVKTLQIETGVASDAQSIRLDRQPGFTAEVVGSQIFLNCYSNVMVWDTYTPTSSAEATVRRAGLLPLGFQQVNTVSGSGTALPAKSWAVYVAVSRRIVGSKTVLSAPSSPTVALNYNSTTQNQDCYFRANSLPNGAGSALLKAGDYVDVYRTKSKPWPDPTGGGGFRAYPTAEEVGSEYLKAFSFQITTAHLTNGGNTFTVTDTTPDSQLTEALYTNQAVTSAGSSALTPPAARLLASYKGSLFGFGTTHPPALKLRARALYGNTFGAPAEVIASGMGIFQVTGTHTSGSPTFTSVSAADIANIRVGQFAFSPGFPSGGTVITVGATSFTINVNASASGTDSFSVYDQVSVDGTLFSSAPWQSFVFGGVVFSQYIIPEPLGLSLGPYTIASTEVATQPTGGFTLQRIWLKDSRSPLTISATRGANWVPVLPDYPATPLSIPEIYDAPAFEWSEKNAPESWAPVSVDYFSKGMPCAVASTRDAIIAFYTDAIWRVSGTGGTAGKGYDWRADPIATNITANGSQAVAVLSDVVYAQSSDGLLGISGSNIRLITQGRVHDQLDCPPWSDGPYTTATARFTVADEEHNEIMFREPSASNGRMWIYNTNTDRLSQTISHAEPFHGDYSRFLRTPLIVGRDGGSTWTVKAQTGAYRDFNLTYQDVYADNPFAQRHWQTLNVTASLTSGYAYITPDFNGTGSVTSRLVDSSGRVSFEVPRNAPAIGNTLGVKLYVTTNTRVKLTGFALDYRDHTERRSNR